MAAFQHLVPEFVTGKVRCASLAGGATHTQQWLLARFGPTVVTTLHFMDTADSLAALRAVGFRTDVHPPRPRDYTPTSSSLRRSRKRLYRRITEARPSHGCTGHRAPGYPPHWPAASLRQASVLAPERSRASAGRIERTRAIGEPDSKRPNASYLNRFPSYRLASPSCGGRHPRASAPFALSGRPTLRSQPAGTRPVRRLAS